VVLLRGINVGRNKRVAMADLRALMEDLGCTEVRTHLNSGNVILTSSARKGDTLARKIEKALHDQLGLSVCCLVRSRDEIHEVVDGHPMADLADNGSRMMVHFLSDEPGATQLAAHDPTSIDPDRARMGPKVIYQWCPDGILEAPNIGGFVEKELGLTVTARNWNTVAKLAELLDA
jgi:uncharacterized protein (DUF1697 family)